MKLLLVLICLYTFGLFAQEDKIWMCPNAGQWENEVLYRVDLKGGKMYLEEEGFTFLFYENPRNHGGDEFHDHGMNEIESIRAHALKSRFLNSSFSKKISDSDQASHYLNYFIGDKDKWRSKVHPVSKVKYANFYEGIDLEVDGLDSKLKYSFFLQPFANSNQIKTRFDGADELHIDSKGDLHIKTPLGEIIEEHPIAWNIDANGKKTTVTVNFKLTDGVLSYSFPDDYDKTQQLVIDPNLVFSTFTGSTTDNWGMTATPGPNGETFAGGISFGVGYPVTTGAFDLSYNGGNANGGIPGFDVAISKFNTNGTQLLFSTYIGGAGNELPESMISTTNGDLYVLGITSSSNFPMGPNPYDNTYAGGPSQIGNGLLFLGSDLFIAKLNANGTALLASTYVGGQNLDGLNVSSLSYNYGDQFRGEIILDGSENIYVSSNTFSTDFPHTDISNTLQGSQDAVVFKMNPTLNSMIWSRFFGGGVNETGNSLELSSDNELFVTGGTTSSGLSFTGADISYAGGVDGYLAKFNATTGTLITGTYMGDAEYDQSYFVKLDIDNNPYVYGQTETTWAVTPGKYVNPNSGQFLRKYENSLATVTWTTQFGSGSGHPEISPTALLISDCYDIFVSGWGGTVNSSNSDAIHSSSNGFPVTADAFQSSTNGSNFYLGIFGNDANNLIYGTYMGGVSGSSNHVDGGTSRFDKSGAVYHAVCAACSGNDFGFTTTPGVWAQSNPSPNCNLAAFKFQLGLPYSLSPNSTICEGSTSQLSATGGTTYSWTPTTSLSNPNIANPIATPTQTTVYYVDMNFNDGCSIVDSIIVTVIKYPIINISSNTQICKGDTITLNAQSNGTGNTYSWSPNINISNTSSAIVDVWPSESRYYYCTITSSCFTNRDSVWVEVFQPQKVIASNDTVICQGNTALLTAYASLNPIWLNNPTLTVINTTQANATPISPTYYYATGLDANNCVNRDSVRVSFFPIPELTISNDTAICFQSSTSIEATGGTSYSWTPVNSLSNSTVSNPIATPLQPTNYIVNIGYGQNCFLNQDVFVDLLYLPFPVLPDTVFSCYGIPKEITAQGADSYIWTPADYLNVSTGPTVVTTPPDTFVYLVEFTNVCGTVSEDVVVVPVKPDVNAFNDTIICPYQSAYLYATGGLSYTWSPSSSLNISTSSSVVSKPSIPTNYLVVGNDQYGCIDSAFVFVDLFPLPYIKASPDAYLLEGDVVQLSATSSTDGPYIWSPSEYLSCVNCDSPIASPPVEYHYVVSYTDENGCSDSDDVWVFFDALVWVPNTFTPNGSGTNDVFKVKGGNVQDLKLYIYNRWGELVKTLHGIDDYWDGTYNDVVCQDGTYTWKMTYKDLRGSREELVGHVNLVR